MKVCMSMEGDTKFIYIEIIFIFVSFLK